MSSSNHQKICHRSTTASGDPCIVHKNEDYPHWELPMWETFPCACGKKQLDRRLLVLCELLPKEQSVALTTIKNEQVVADFLRSGPVRQPKTISGIDITEELAFHNVS